MNPILLPRPSEKSKIPTFLIILLLLVGAGLQAAERPVVLVYTHNGLTVEGKKGYVHDNIAASVATIKKIGDEQKFEVVNSDDPAIFTNAPLKKYRVIVFSNSNNKAFDNEEERKAFQDYIHGGGGFVAIHSATGSERDWPWFWKLAGGSFSWHAPLQKFTIEIKDKEHPSTSFFQSDTWDWEDEFYVLKEQPSDLHVLFGGNIKPLKGAEKKAEGLPDFIPLAWYHEFEGGRAFTTTLGHKKEYYSDANFVKHLTGGIRWAGKMGR